VIRQCTDIDFETIYSIVNDGAQAYRGVIPEDCFHRPYMSTEELGSEIAGGVVFWGYELESALVGVMGIQDIDDVTLVRHAYVRTACQRRGIGSKLLSFLRARTVRPVLIGTWADAVWAVEFYEKHGFRLVEPQDHARLLRQYWSIADRQIETSVVLADERWHGLRSPGG